MPTAAARETPSWWMPADWPAPARVRAGITTRRGGVSRQPYQGFNLALHVGDEPSAVTANRVELRRGLQLPRDPCWLQQVHGKRVVEAAAGTEQTADGSHASGPGHVCAILVADCVPLLLTDRTGMQVAAIHAGWRGIAAGVVETALASMATRADQLLAWIGPCIGVACYEVGADVRSACLQSDPDSGACFVPTANDRWNADLGRIVRGQLQRHGVRAIHGSGLCVSSNANLFFSHRRDGQTGRMAALVWIDEDHS